MKNYWLNKRDWIATVNMVENKDNTFYGKWYVSGYFEKDLNCVVTGDTFFNNYNYPYFHLHKDGTWDKSTRKNNEWSGYYDTKEEAESVLRNSEVPSWQFMH